MEALSPEPIPKEATNEFVGGHSLTTKETTSWRAFFCLGSFQLDCISRTGGPRPGKGDLGAELRVEAPGRAPGPGEGEAEIPRYRVDLSCKHKCIQETYGLAQHRYPYLSLYLYIYIIHVYGYILWSSSNRGLSVACHLSVLHAMLLDTYFGFSAASMIAGTGWLRNRAVIESSLLERKGGGRGDTADPFFIYLFAFSCFTSLTSIASLEFL